MRVRCLMDRKIDRWKAIQYQFLKTFQLCSDAKKIMAYNREGKLLHIRLILIIYNFIGKCKM